MQAPATQPRSERGMALIAVLLLLMLSSALTAALAISATTETKVADNHRLSAEARAAAEAGLIHAAQLTISTVQNWQTNGHASPSAAMSALLRGPDNQTGNASRDADNGSLENLGIPRPPARLQLAGLSGVFYEARLYDEDDPARGVTLSSADRTRISEDNQPYNDSNRRIIVQATGYSNGDTIARLEAIIGSSQLAAIVTNGNLTISGNPTINGSGGSVHSNGNLTLSGNPSVSQNATASGTYTTTGNPSVGGTSGSGYALQTVPDINASDYLGAADYILRSDGTLTNSGGSVICNGSGNGCKNTYGWEYSTGEWRVGGNTLATGTYYAQTPVRISGNPGSDSSPVQVSLIAEGSIEITGNPDVRSDLPDVLLVTDGDLKVSGNFQSHGSEAQILVKEQLQVSGNASFSGQILVQDVLSVDPLVTSNRISGNPTVTYNGTTGTSSFIISGWRWQ